jgi:CRP/FNR family transcriptional regulator, cyclic AMP receptor protein
VVIMNELLIDRETRAGAVQALSMNSMFEGLQERELAEVAAACVNRRFARGEILCHQGQPGDWMCIIASGLVKVVFASPEGDEFLLSTHGPGSAIGEVAVFDGLGRSASVVAVRPTTAYFLSRDRLTALICDHPVVLKEALGVLGDLVRRLTEQVSELAFLNLAIRLARVLLRLAEEQIFALGSPFALDTGLTQSEIGTMVGASRPAVNRALQLLAAEGGIEVSGRLIVIRDLAALRLSATS